jgi:2-polyprenyl-3-methyl-5-hydroxy-6-metoxy-1,4-benzoquinol methylase
MALLSDTSLFAPLPSRSTEREWLDDLEIRGPELEAGLHELELSNRYLGGHRALLQCLQRALPWLPQRRLRLVDVGCGRGDGLRAIARWGRRNNIPLELVGLDANGAAIDEARKHSKDFSDIRYVEGDAFGSALGELLPDVVTASLLLHHFTTPSLASHLPQLLQHAPVLVIADLHRHPLAHAGFRALTKVLGACPMTRHDGAVSIRRAFTRNDLLELIAPLDLRHWSIHWSFAFRYEVLLVRNP